MSATGYSKVLTMFLATVLLGAACGGGNHQVPTCAISGTVTGAVSAGVTLTLSGAQTGTATSDATGKYEFARLARGDYTVTPAKADYVFSSAAATVTVNCVEVSTLDFIASVAASFTHYRIPCNKANGNTCCFNHLGPGDYTVYCETIADCQKPTTWPSYSFTCPDVACQGDVCCYSKQTDGYMVLPCWL